MYVEILCSQITAGKCYKLVNKCMIITIMLSIFYLVLDVLSPVSIQQRVSRFLECLACWADMCNHNCGGVTTQRILNKQTPTNFRMGRTCNSGKGLVPQSAAKSEEKMGAALD